MTDSLTIKKIKQEYIIFKLNLDYYAVRIETLNQIIPTPQMRFVPNLPNYILGVIDIDEQMVPVLDLKKRMKLTSDIESSAPTKPLILIFEQENRLISFTVDDVFELKVVLDEPKTDFSCVPEDIHIFSDGTLRIQDKNFNSDEHNNEELVIVLNLKKIYNVIKRELNINGNI